jgi:hypothetical protein
MAEGLCLRRQGSNWKLIGASHGAVSLANEYLAYLADRNLFVGEPLSRPSQDNLGCGARRALALVL